MAANSEYIVRSSAFSPLAIVDQYKQPSQRTRLAVVLTGQAMTDSRLVGDNPDSRHPARYRTSFTVPELLKPDAVYDPLWAAASVSARPPHPAGTKAAGDSASSRR
jgi:hypothetical protein